MPRKVASLILGDFLEVSSSLKASSFDFVFADPPYFLSTGGISVSSGKQVRVNKGHWDEPDMAPGGSPQDFHRAWISRALELLKPDGSIVISGTYHSIFDYGVALKEQKAKILNDIVWFKPNGAPNLSRRRVTASHETLVWASRYESSKFTYNYNEMRSLDPHGDKIKVKDRQLRSVWWIPTTPAREKTFGRHPTQKPLALMERLILAFTEKGANVLDPFMGSGTTGLACKNHDRKFTGIELNEEYFEIAKKRMGV